MLRKKSMRSHDLDVRTQEIWQKVSKGPLWDRNPKIMSDALVRPIEHFKTQSQNLFPKPLPYRFLSSGTSQQQRSHSQFSHLGLALYREGSLKTFLSVLGHFFPAPEKIKGYSLIPSIAEWEDSSLAQMITWISEIVPVSFSKPKKNLAGPVWVFGTGFHFIELHDRGYRCPLPAGSIVIETGGTKGRTREVSRPDLHKAIHHIFSQPDHPSTVVSEYGMCELACQAYEFSKDSKTQFRFPSWVRLGVQKDGAKILSSGRGALVIQDPLRVDCTEAIRTQDFVELDEDGSFKLLGRLPHTVLKGCSLNAESLLYKKTKKMNVPSKNPEWTPEINRKTIKFFSENLSDWLCSPEVKESLLHSFFSETIVDWAIEDLLADLPQDQSSWETIVNKSYSQTSPERWLLVAPQTHPIAIIYPLILALCLNLKLTLRCPKTHEAFFNLLKSFLKDLGPVKYMSSLERLDHNSHQQFDACLIFGSDETIARVRAETNLKIQGFGSKFAFDVIDAHELEDNLVAIQKDIYSLSGLGCLSARALVVIDHDKTFSFNGIINKLNKMPQASLPLDHKIRIFQISEYLRNQGELCYQDPNGLLWIVRQLIPEKSLEDYLMPYPWCISIIKGTVNELEPLMKQCSSNPKHYTYASASTHFNEGKALGKLNRFPWDGSLDGKALFVTGSE